MQKLLVKSSLLRLAESAPSLEYLDKAFASLEQHKIRLDADACLFHSGELLDRYFFVQSGSALAVDLEGKVLFEYQAGQGFGEQFLVLERATAPVGVRAGAEGCDLVSVSRAAFQQQFAQIFSSLGPFRGRVVRAKSNSKSMALGRDVGEFRGIPFASTSSRFALPVVVEYHAGGHHVDAFEFGPECAQIQATMAAMLGPGSKPRDRPATLDFLATRSVDSSEDCLVLNVFTPLLQSQSTKLPVMVWIHGGAFVTGSGSQPPYNGRELASKGVVVVTINYRLGALGFLTGVPGLENNLGLHDQVAALRWVKRHVASFGGDGNNITVFGESAGGMSATSLLGTRVRREEQLFHRCIVQSGGGHAIMNEQQAAEVAHLFFTSLGDKLAMPVEQVTLDVLNTCALQLIIDATTFTLSKAASLQSLFGYAIPFQPVVLHNGPTSKDLLFGCVPPLVAIARGIADDVSLLVGVNNNEYTLFMMDGAWRRKYHKLERSRQAYREFLCQRLLEFASERDTRHRPVANLPVRAQQVVDFYLPQSDGEFTEDEANLAFERIHSCWLFEIGSDQLLGLKLRDGGNRPAYSYRVAFQSPMQELKSAHAIDLPLVFGTYKTDPLGVMLCGGDSPEASACSRDMMSCWVKFAQGNGSQCFSTAAPRLFGETASPSSSTSYELVPGSLFKTPQERRVWRGFMEKTEISYAKL